MAKADFERAKSVHPSITSMGEDDWMAFFRTSAGEHAFGRILGDIYDIVKAGEEKEAGLHRMGRRPRRDGTLADVYATVFPIPYTMDPFPMAMVKLLAGRSHRAFAPKIPMHQTQFSRLMRGIGEPDMATLESVARAAKVEPEYFLEWRAMKVAQIIQLVCMSQPNVGITAYKSFSKVAK